MKTVLKCCLLLLIALAVGACRQLQEAVETVRPSATAEGNCWTYYEVLEFERWNEDVGVVVHNWSLALDLREEMTERFRSDPKVIFADWWWSQMLYASLLLRDSTKSYLAESYSLADPYAKFDKEIRRQMEYVLAASEAFETAYINWRFGNLDKVVDALDEVSGQLANIDPDYVQAIAEDILERMPLCP